MRKNTNKLTTVHPPLWQSMVVSSCPFLSFPLLESNISQVYQPRYWGPVSLRSNACLPLVIIIINSAKPSRAIASLQHHDREKPPVSSLWHGDDRSLWSWSRHLYLRCPRQCCQSRCPVSIYLTSNSLTSGNIITELDCYPAQVQICLVDNARLS